MHPPQRFDTPGLVVLGCNIHDNMLGYILVVDTPHHALTGEEGSVSLAGLPAGDYDVRIWTPRAAPKDLPAEVRVSLDEQQPAVLDFSFSGRLFPPHESAESSLSWLYY